MILGISANYHDSAVALIDDVNVLFAAQEERFSRIKGDSSFPLHSLNAMERQIGISLNDISRIAYYENPKLKRHRITKTFVENFPQNYKQIYDFVTTFDSERFYAEDFLKRKFPNHNIDFFSHHQSHAASTFFCSKFDEAAVLVMDGVGEWSSTSIYLGKENQLNLLHEDLFPNSIGLLYATFTAYCGFKVNSGEYKLMGLAPYGEPKFTNLISDYLYRIDENSQVSLNMKYFGFTREKKMWSKHLESLLGVPPRKPESEITQEICDLASSIQVALEEIVKNKTRTALKLANQSNLCLAGGVALNCVSNSKLLNIVPAKNIFIQPASGDAGGALGAALLSRIQQAKNYQNSIRYSLSNAFLGTSYSKNEVERVLRNNKLEFSELSEFEKSEVIAKLLIEGNSIGWFKGRMEYGPRALGARSIIANAYLPDTQKKLNLQIKKRESFRPFAPIILKSEVDKWFEWDKDTDSNFMLFVAKILQEHRTYEAKFQNHETSLMSKINEIRSIVPAITHLDYSARLQTIDESNYLYNLLQKFYELTKIPILVNTSFNVRNEPIVESPIDAIRCFLTTEIDVLVIEDFIVKKKDLGSEILDFWKNKYFVGEQD